MRLTRSISFHLAYLGPIVLYNGYQILSNAQNFIEKLSGAGGVVTGAGVIYIFAADIASGTSVEKYMPHSLAQRGVSGFCRRVVSTFDEIY